MAPTNTHATPSPTVAIAGATGAVGREMLDILGEREFPIRELRLLASPRSAGQKVTFRGREHTIAALDERSFEGVDIALFSAGGDISKKFAPLAVAAGAIIIDNSSAFRMDPAVPLIVPEINPEAMEHIEAPWHRRPAGESHRSRSAGGIIANPNCSTIILLVPLTPIRKVFGIERIIVSTYQAASGAGAKGMAELEEQTRAALDGRHLTPKQFPEPYAFNLFSHDSAMDPATGRNKEEQKMIDETRKIWNDDRVGVSATCIRVPVLRAHSESINITLGRPARRSELTELLEAAPGVSVVDDRAANRFPTPGRAAGRDDVYVGRLRPDSSSPLAAGADPADPDAPSRHFDLFVSGDQLRKGAALNAIQIAELILQKSGAAVGA
jgi:aspartate-semialdehyde dehydrogenase